MRKGWESCLAQRREGSGVIFLIYMNTCRECVERMESGYFQWCPVTGSGAMGTNWNTGGSLWTSGNSFLLWRSPRTGTSHPGEFWSLHLWRYSKAVWIWSWTTSSRTPVRAGGLDQMASSGSFQLHPFCDSVILWVKPRSQTRVKTEGRGPVRDVSNFSRSGQGTRSWVERQGSPRKQCYCSRARGMHTSYGSLWNQ